MRDSLRRRVTVAPQVRREDRFPVFAVTAALAMAGLAVEAETVAGWDDVQRRDAYEWAIREALAEAEPATKRFPRPPHVSAAVRGGGS